MKINLAYYNERRRCWKDEQEYDDLPPEYAQEIAAACENLKSYIAHLQGKARDTQGLNAQPAIPYRFTFSFKADNAPDGVPGRWSGEAEATDLLYSQVLAIQKAGNQLQARLIESGELEVASGQRQ